MGESDLVRFLLDKIDVHGFWFIGFLAILVLIGLSWIRQYYRRRDTKNGKGHVDDLQDSVRQLFLELDCFLEGPEQEPRKVFLRSLTPDKATMLTTDSALQKGTMLKIDFSPILGAQDTESNRLAHARISRCRSVGGSPESFLINVQFISSGRSWAPLAIQRHMNESIDRLHGKPPQLEVL